MFDLLGAIQLTASAAIIIAILSFALARHSSGRMKAAVALSLWFAVVVALGATLALDNPAGAGTPGLGLAVMLPIVILCLVFTMQPSVRAAIAAVPMHTLVAMNITRVIGYMFVALMMSGRLPASFALIAGWGDIFVGVTAIPVAWLASRGEARARPIVLLWNVAGFLDLMAAIGLGVTSSPGPLRVFTAPPGSAIMTTLPWILIPCFVVPALQAVHIAIFLRLAKSTSAALAVPAH